MNKYVYYFITIIIFCACCFEGVTVRAQDLTADLSAVHVDQLSDEQILQLMQRASQQGLSDSQLAQMAERRGLSPGEMQKLERRISAIKRKHGLDSLNYKTDSA